MNESNLRRAIFSQLYIMKAQFETLIMMVEELENKVDENCTHPVEHRLNLTTMGGSTHWKCKVCGFEFNGEKVDTSE